MKQLTKKILAGVAAKVMMGIGTAFLIVAVMKQNGWYLVASIMLLAVASVAGVAIEE